MHAYKFRITSDDNDDFLREISVLANQSFEDFHKAIVETCKFDGNELASFYLCDNQWRKKVEITLVDMKMDEAEYDFEEEKNPALVMKNTKLNQAINDPHQKLLYVYDFLKMITLNAELVKILPAEKTTLYPIVSKSESDISTSSIKISPIVEEEQIFIEEDLDNETISTELDNISFDDETRLYGNIDDL